MNQNDIKAMQRRIGSPMTVLGTQEHCGLPAHLRNLMPAKNPWPATDQTSLSKFYGAAGDESQLTMLGWLI